MATDHTVEALSANEKKNEISTALNSSFCMSDMYQFLFLVIILSTQSQCLSSYFMYTGHAIASILAAIASIYSSQCISHDWR